MKIRVGIDIMGSDAPPERLIEAVVKGVTAFSQSHSFFVFCTPAYQQLLPCTTVLCTEVIAMEDQPLSAVRQKRDSTLVRGIKALADKSIDVFITAGNTGALIAASSLFLPLISSVKRPVLAAEIPTVKNPLVILDVGGRIAQGPEELALLASLGAHRQRERLKIALPKVALLNIGAERIKGGERSVETYQLLSKGEGGYTFVGNIEARQIFSGDVDVLVTDGFSGNVLVKALEGTADFIFDFLTKEGIDISSYQSHFSYEGHPGAEVLGVEGRVVKCHGAATARSLYSAISGVCGA